MMSSHTQTPMLKSFWKGTADKNRINWQDDDVISSSSHHALANEKAPGNHDEGGELSAKGTVGSDRQTDPVEGEREREVNAQSEWSCYWYDTNKLKENVRKRTGFLWSSPSKRVRRLHTAEADLNIHEEKDKVIQLETERTVENNSEQQGMPLQINSRMELSKEERVKSYLQGWRGGADH